MAGIDVEKLITEQEKENIAIKEASEKQAFEAAEKEKKEVIERVKKEVMKEFAEKHKNEKLPPSYAEELINGDLYMRLEQEAIQAGKDEHYYTGDFLDDMIDFSHSVIEAVKDYLDEVKDKVLDKLDEAGLAIDPEWQAEQTQNINDYPSLMAERFGHNGWQEKLAEELAKSGEVKTVRQMVKTMEEYNKVLENTKVEDFSAFLENSDKYRDSWEKDYARELSESGKYENMGEALNDMLSHERWREKEPELALIEDYKYQIADFERRMEKAEGQELKDLQEYKERAVGAYYWAKRQANEKGRIIPDRVLIEQDLAKKQEQKEQVQENRVVLEYDIDFEREAKQEVGQVKEEVNEQDKEEKKELKQEQKQAKKAWNRSLNREEYLSAKHDSQNEAISRCEEAKSEAIQERDAMQAEIENARER